MTYKIHEILPEPVVKGLDLEVAGEVIATALPIPGYRWRLTLGEDNLHVDLGGEVHARRVLAWIGEQVSPPSAVISGPDDLRLAKPDVIYRTDYNDGNQYRVDSEGNWHYNTPFGIFDGHPFTECPGHIPYYDVYPLVEMR